MGGFLGVSKNRCTVTMLVPRKKAVGSLVNLERAYCHCSCILFIKIKINK